MNAVERTLLRFVGERLFDRSRLSLANRSTSFDWRDNSSRPLAKNAFSLAISSSNSLLATFMAAFVATIVGFFTDS